jgi:hypothetical protein
MPSLLGLAVLGLAAIFTLMVLLIYPNVGATIVRILRHTLLLALGAALIILLFIAIFRINPWPFIRRSAMLQAANQVVDFAAFLPREYRLEEVYYEDTDGDGQNEWVVFYQFDLVDGRSPFGGAVYDYDRGEPPALFPYRLLPPDRDYLSELTIRLAREHVVATGEVTPTQELLVYGSQGGLDTELTIFRHIPNTLPWEPPRDEPRRRYQAIGNFRGNAGVEFDQATKEVTVDNRAGRERSQLAVRQVYRPDETRGTYMSPTDPDILGAPVSSEVMFAFGMPDNILETPYPEKIALAFYEMLDVEPPQISPEQFLTGQALVEYRNNNLAYFGLEGAASAEDISDVQLKQLSYSPEVEELTATPTVLGMEPRLITVTVDFEARIRGVLMRAPSPIQWVLTVVEGKWKLDHRL